MSDVVAKPEERFVRPPTYERDEPESQGRNDEDQGSCQEKQNALAHLPEKRKQKAEQGVKRKYIAILEHRMDETDPEETSRMLRRG